MEHLADRGEKPFLLLFPVYDASSEIVARNQYANYHRSIEGKQERVLGYDRDRDDEPSAVEEVSDVSGKGLVESHYQYRSHERNQREEEVSRRTEQTRQIPDRYDNGQNCECNVKDKVVGQFHSTRN